MSKKTRKKTIQNRPCKAAKATRRKVRRTRAAQRRKAAPQAKQPAKAARSIAQSSGETGKAASPKSPLKVPPRTAESRCRKPNPASNGVGRGRKSARLPFAPRRRRDGFAGAIMPGRKLVLFFYPRADTPGCTREAIDFTRLAGAFAESRTAVLGVSADPPKAQEAFRNKHELAIPLVSDEKHEMLEAYGVWGEKSMYGRTFHGHSSHDGFDRRRWPDRQNLAQCEGRRPCRRGAGGRAVRC